MDEEFDEEFFNGAAPGENQAGKKAEGGKEPGSAQGVGVPKPATKPKRFLCRKFIECIYCEKEARIALIIACLCVCVFVSFVLAVQTYQHVLFPGGDGGKQEFMRRLLCRRQLLRETAAYGLQGSVPCSAQQRSGPEPMEAVHCRVAGSRWAGTWARSPT